MAPDMSFYAKDPPRCDKKSARDAALITVARSIVFLDSKTLGFAFGRLLKIATQDDVNPDVSERVAGIAYAVVRSLDPNAANLILMELEPSWRRKRPTGSINRIINLLRDRQLHQ